MIDLKKASEKAVEYIKLLYADQDLGKIVVEEAELSDDDRFWKISLSFKRPDVAAGMGESVFAGNRSYKIFKLDAESGQVRSMKNRTQKYDT